MGTDLLLLAVGLTCLYFGAEWLVRGSSGLATAFGVRPIVVGLTVVAYGTSAPEMIVESTASFQGKSPIVLGDCVGSNIFNVLFVLGVAGSVRPVPGSVRELQSELIALGAVSLLTLFSLRGERRMPRWEGAMLIAAYATFVGLLVAGR